MSTDSSSSGGPGPSGLHSYIHEGGPQDVQPHWHWLQPYWHWVAPERVATETWTVPQLCAAYQWPTGLDGGAKIAIVELDGGWTDGDMQQFFDGIGQPMPQIQDVLIDGTGNNPNRHLGDPHDPDGEVALDIEVAAAAYYVATGQPAEIRVYWARDIARAVRAATADGCDVCSISWGADEAHWGAAAGDDMEQAAEAATAAGMVVFAASGDNNSGDGGPNAANVDLPASAPHVVGCGGTRKTAGSERVWNDDPGNPTGEGTGGGFSTLFKPMPSWQLGAPHGQGRMVPDVAANADPVTAFEVVVHGDTKFVGGTSAVAPLYAGLFAALGTKLGFITPKLYANSVCFNDVTAGDNGAFRAGVGPDPCTGLGSPIGSRLANLFAPKRSSSKQKRPRSHGSTRMREAAPDSPSQSSPAL